jgi:hypothetical protein
MLVQLFQFGLRIFFEVISVSLMAIAGRSLMKPVGLKYSTLARILAVTECLYANRRHRTKGI